MTDKDFDEIMQQYVETTKSSAKDDLKKLKEAEIQHPHNNKSKFNKNRLWFMVATIVAIVLVITVTVPLAINQNVPTGPIIYQITSNDIIDSDDSSIDQLDNCQSLLIPSIESVYSETSLWLLKENNKAIGAEQVIDVYDEYIENITTILLKKEYKYNLLYHYDDLLNSYVWRNCNVNFETVSSVIDFQYNNYIFLSYGQYNYYISVITYEELSICDLLDRIY